MIDKILLILGLGGGVGLLALWAWIQRLLESNNRLNADKAKAELEKEIGKKEYKNEELKKTAKRLHDEYLDHKRKLLGDD